MVESPLSISAKRIPWLKAYLKHCTQQFTQGFTGWISIQSIKANRNYLNFYHPLSNMCWKSRIKLIVSIQHSMNLAGLHVQYFSERHLMRSFTLSPLLSMRQALTAQSNSYGSFYSKANPGFRVLPPLSKDSIINSYSSFSQCLSNLSLSVKLAFILSLYYFALFAYSPVQYAISLSQSSIRSCKVMQELKQRMHCTKTLSFVMAKRRWQKEDTSQGLMASLQAKQRCKMSTNSQWSFQNLFLTNDLMIRGSLGLVDDRAISILAFSQMSYFVIKLALIVLQSCRHLVVLLRWEQTVGRRRYVGLRMMGISVVWNVAYIDVLHSSKNEFQQRQIILRKDIKSDLLSLSYLFSFYKYSCTTSMTSILLLCPNSIFARNKSSFSTFQKVLFSIYSRQQLFYIFQIIFQS